MCCMKVIPSCFFESFLVWDTGFVEDFRFFVLVERERQDVSGDACYSILRKYVKIHVRLRLSLCVSFLPLFLSVFLCLYLSLCLSLSGSLFPVHL